MKRLYCADMLWVPLVIISVLWRSLVLFGSSLGLWLSVIAGLILWTLIEYTVHRWLHRMKHPGHFAHHRDPNGKHGPNVWQTVLILTTLCIVPSAIFGLKLTLGLDSGMLAGYANYLYIHNGIHMTKLFPNSRLRKLHEDHHAGKNDIYGVTTDLWDRVFRRPN